MSLTEDTPVQVNRIHHMMGVSNAKVVHERGELVYNPTKRMRDILKRAKKSGIVENGVHYKVTNVPLGSFEVYFMGVLVYSKLLTK